MAFHNEIHSEAQIDATAQEVWDVLTDLPSWGEWNPGFASAEGRAEVGTTLHMTFVRAGGRTMKMHPTVLVADPGREFRWIGRVLIPGIFDGEHRFVIREDEPGRVTFVQDERFRGVLVPFLRKMIEVDTAATFVKVNEALTARVASVRAAG